jgi:hypothetical protein
MTFLKPTNLRLYANQRWCQWCGEARSCHGFDRHTKACERDFRIVKQHKMAKNTTQRLRKVGNEVHSSVATSNVINMMEDVLMTPGAQSVMLQLPFSNIQLTLRPGIRR